MRKGYIEPEQLVSTIGSVAYLQKSNNDRMIAIQEYGGLQPDTGEVSITFMGVMSFKIVTPKGIVMLIDPWRNPPYACWGYWFLMAFPKTPCDIGLMTHAHADHDALHRLEASMILDRMTGSFEIGDVKITGIADKHVCENQSGAYDSNFLREYYGNNPCPPNEAMEWCNTMFLFETGGLRILHWGDNRQNPPKEIWEKIQDIDIAILPISDDGYVLTSQWGRKIADKLDAKVIIPAHYTVKGINVPLEGWEESAIQFTRSMEHTLLDTHTILLSPDKIKKYKRHVMYFGDHVPFPVAIYEKSKHNAEIPPLPEPVKAWERFKPEQWNRR